MLPEELGVKRQWFGGLKEGERGEREREKGWKGEEDERVKAQRIEAVGERGRE